MDLKVTASTGNINKKKQAEKTNCEICNRKSIQIIDLGPHINGRKHRSNLRKQKNKDEGKKILQTNKYEKQKKEGLDSIRKKYNSWKSNRESYVVPLAANLCLLLALNRSVQDFFIAVNDKDWGAFGDIVIEIVNKTRTTIYAIKCKKISSRYRKFKHLNEASILLEKEKKCIDEIKKNENIKKGITNTTFAIFSPMGTEQSFVEQEYYFKLVEEGQKEEKGKDDIEEEILLKEKERKKIPLSKERETEIPLKEEEEVEGQEIALKKIEECKSPLNEKDGKEFSLKEKGEKGMHLNKKEGKIISFKIQSLNQDHLIDLTRDRSNIFGFFQSENLENENLPFLLFFVNQRVPKDIFEGKSSIFSGCPNINEHYIKYIKDWVQGKLGGNYKLGKSDIILKLGQIVLHRYILKPKLIINLKQTTFEAWNKVLDNVDLAIVEDEPFIINKICQPFNKIIEDTFEIKILTMSRTICLENKINRSTDTLLKAYLFEETNDLKEDIHLLKIYTVMWKCGKLPLLLSADTENDQWYIQDVISFMKKQGVTRKFLLKSKELKNLNKEIKIFSCLEDVKNLVDLDNFYIKVNNDFKLSLRTISSTDSLFLKWITPSIFFDITLEKYYIKPSTVKNGKGRSELKIILKNSIIKELYQLFHKNDNNNTLSEEEPQAKLVRNLNSGRYRDIDSRILY